MIERQNSCDHQAQPKYSHNNHLKGCVKRESIFDPSSGSDSNQFEPKLQMSGHLVQQLDHANEIRPAEATSSTQPAYCPSFSYQMIVGAPNANYSKRWESGDRSCVSESTHWKKLHDELQQKYQRLKSTCQSLKKEVEAKDMQIKNLLDSTLCNQISFLPYLLLIPLCE